MCAVIPTFSAPDLTRRLCIISDDLARKSRCVDEGQRLRLTGDMSLFRLTPLIMGHRSCRVLGARQ